MASRAHSQASGAVLIAALLMGAPAHAAVVVGADGKPVRPATGPNLLIGEARGGACKIPPGDRVVAFNLALETKLEDAIAWISSVTCKSFLVPGTIRTERLRLTMVAPERITHEEAYRLFLGALDAVGLTVEHAGRFERIVETAKIKSMGGIPVHGDGVDMHSVVEEPYVTALVRLKDVPPEGREWLFKPHYDYHYGCNPRPPSDTLIITDLRSNIERVLGRPIPLSPSPR